MIALDRYDRDDIEAQIDAITHDLRIGAAAGGVTIQIPPAHCIYLARRIERQPTVVIAPPSNDFAQRIDAFWHRLCGCFFLSVAALVASDALRDLLSILPW